MSGILIVTYTGKVVNYPHANVTTPYPTGQVSVSILYTPKFVKCELSAICVVEIQGTKFTPLAETGVKQLHAKQIVGFTLLRISVQPLNKD